MICRLTDLRDKEVINVNNGACLGPVSDLEVDTCSAGVRAIIIYGKPKLLGLMGREADTVIRWENIQCIGEDTILVRCGKDFTNSHSSGMFDGLFG